MPLFRRRSEPPVNAYTPLHPPAYSGPARRKREARGKPETAATLRRQLAILAARHATHEFTVSDLGFVVQVHVNHSGSYAEWRAHWDQRLRSFTTPGRPRGSYSAQTWASVDQVPESGWGAIVLPVRTGTTSMVATVPQTRRVKGIAGTPSRRTLPPQPIADPLVGITVQDITVRNSSPELMGMALIADWIEWIPDDRAPRLAPPVFEYVRANGRQLHRELVTWDLDWPLPAPTLPEVA